MEEGREELGGKREEEDEELSSLLAKGSSQSGEEEFHRQRAIAQECCEVGRRLVKQSDWSGAAKEFSKAVMTFEFILKQHASAGGLRSEVADLLKSTIHPAYSNLALCYLKLHNYGLVLTFANQVLASDPGNLKNLYRRALARKATKAYEEAQQDLHKVATLDPSMEQECKRLAHECRLLQREQRQKEKAAAREFIQGYSQQKPAPQPQSEPKAATKTVGEGAKGEKGEGGWRKVWGWVRKWLPC